ncbi:MAG: type II toxin-antitoxin system RelE/ParE family toxin [Acidobacteriaceae bacterium]
MATEVLVTAEFERWWGGLAVEEQKSVAVVVSMLEERGITLPFPYSSSITSSAKLRELRIQHAGQPYRVLYAFDPRRNAVLLLGGNKTGDDRWYDTHVPKAENLFAAYLKESGRSR